MNLSDRHPTYGEAFEDWALMRHAHAGERTVKMQGSLYLPPTGGQLIDGMGVGGAGLEAYTSYLQRAVFHEFVSTAVRAMVGVMHRKDPVIELPRQLQSLINSATIYGEPLKTLLRRVNTEQLITGRVGLLLDLPTDAGPTATPYIATYTTESTVNWDVRVGPDGRKSFDFVSLDETGPQRVAGNLNWQTVQQFRMLTTGEFLASMGITDPAMAAGPHEYVVALVQKGASLLSADFMVPELAGRRLETIPFVMVGSVDLDPQPDQPPLLALARKAMSLYRLEADYRHQLYMQSQDTLVITGQGASDGDASPRLGANAILYLDAGADAKYVGVSAAGLSEMRQAVENEKREAAELGASIIDAASTGSAASGEALNVRIAARTATLASIARAGADGITRLLRLAAVWVGADPDEVKVIPNLDFGELSFTADDLLKLMQAKSSGAPIANRTIHQIMSAHEFTEFTYEEELAEIEEEADPAGEPSALGRVSPDTVEGNEPGQDGERVPTDEDSRVAKGSVPGNPLTTTITR